MTLTCVSCDKGFESVVRINGRWLDLTGRKHCLGCLPHRPLRKPRKPVDRARATLICASCGARFQARQVIDGNVRSLYGRRFCLTCSPFGLHNTSKSPPGAVVPEEMVERRRKRRNAKTYRSLKKRRVRWKSELIEERGGKCAECGYNACRAALEFHHRDPASKGFELSASGVSYARFRAEAEKCDLLCATCHRLRHAALDFGRTDGAVVEHRRRRKERAVLYMGGACEGCGLTSHPAVFEFHHRNAAEKAFGLSERGIPRTWEKTVAELAKCAMLCANCHREVHAGLREVEQGRQGLAEDPGRWKAA